MNPREDLDALWAQAEVHLGRNAGTAAEAIAHKMVGAMPSDARGHVMLARAQAATHGIAHGERALEAAPAHLRETPLFRAWRARLAWEGGHADVARTLVETFPAGEEAPPALRWTRARLAHAQKDLDAACADLVVLTRTTPADKDTWRLLAQCLMTAGKPAVAVIALEYVLAQDRAHAPTWRALVQAHLSAGNVAQSFATVQEALKQHPRDAELLALATQLRALNTATGSDVQARIVDAQLLLDDGRLEEAAALLQALQQQHPTSRSLGFLAQELAVARTPDNQVLRLLADAVKAVSLNHALLEPKVILLSILLRPSPARDLKQALALAEQAWAMAPGHPHVAFLMVRAFVLTGRKGHARVVAQQLAVRAPALQARLGRMTAE